MRAMTAHKPRRIGLGIIRRMPIADDLRQRIESGPAGARPRGVSAMGGTWITDGQGFAAA